MRIKITALGDAVVKLRAQMAMIVTSASASGLTHSQNAPDTLTSHLPRPALTSTPHCPPPPPPPCSSLSSSAGTSSMLDLIRQRNNARGKDSGLTRGSQVMGMPSMVNVLKDLNKVKLRSVPRTPGGGPVKRRRSEGAAALLNDPAALFAQALQKRFAKYDFNNSDQENEVEVSLFGSPETIQVPQHNRRSL